MRVGQKNKLTYRWARTGSRPRAVHDQRTQSTYLFGAVCPERGAGSGLVLPVCNTEAMQLHLDDISTKVAPCAHAILIFDQAGWHGAKALKTPANISLMPLPPRSPELNPQENEWQTVCSLLVRMRLALYATSEDCVGWAGAEPHAQRTSHATKYQGFCRS